MKKLSIEQKAEAYDKVLEKAKSWYVDAQIDFKKSLEALFPELKESEDERIREALIDGFTVMKESKNCGKTFSDYHIPVADILAWLEKQGEKEEPQVYETEDGKVITYSESEGYKVFVEPKFKVGDWITNGDYTWKIVEVKPLDYILQSQDGNIVDDTISHVDEQFHSFTIDDAKDGDVLVEDKISSYPSPFIAIFKTKDSVDTFSSHCFIGFDEIFYEGEARHCSENLHPATKEQCDLLFQKMKDARYTFDFEKKELKKIENEIEIPFGAKDSKLQEAIYYIPKGFHAKIDDDKVVIKKGEKSTAWSEEDEDMIQALGACIDAVIKSGMNYISFDSKSILIGKVKNWLKSLKDRITWKPSEEQMGVIEAVMNNRSFQRRHLNSLYEQLKKLREE